MPRLVLIADGFTRPEVARRTLEAVRAGGGWVHLRDHAAAEAAFEAAAYELAARLREAAPGVTLSVNGRLAVAARLGCGLHTGAHGPTVAAARRVLGPDVPVGYSAHTAAEAATAAGADYFFFSPVFPTGSKPGHPGAGLDALRAFCAAFPQVPVFALGGVSPERVSSCRAAGARGVAVVSGILAAPDPAAAVQAYLRAITLSNPKSKIPNPKSP